MSLNSYDSRYPADYYEVGTCYSFYKGTDFGNQRSATIEEENQFAKALEKCIKENKHLIADGGSSYNHNISRVVGVVINKGPLPSKEFKDALDVMFSNENGNYIVSRYGISGIGVFMNDKEDTITGKTVASSYIPRGRVTGVKAETNRGPQSGPTAVTESGPTKVNESGPTVVRESGPTKVG